MSGGGRESAACCRAARAVGDGGGSWKGVGEDGQQAGGDRLVIDAVHPGDRRQPFLPVDDNHSCRCGFFSSSLFSCSRRSPEVTAPLHFFARRREAVASGILLGEGELRGAFAALLLAVGNVTALTLAAILTFRWRGMRPRNWWQVDRARRSARLGVAIFVVLLSALAALIVASQTFGGGLQIR